ncbi:SAM-dependent methyltransferase [Pseudoxanthomonas winnipegensis]|jgi:cyclopropane-fatty-acyl-phospholipid synthase|uniref:Class I SAM-dependent methyltransferase n=1 Tax=Pseudoxanthomonas winnipegensis TaxID=2480810 RepID=A0A4Q8L4J4_9GAMM|nr:cyclopropane-fatty-acyl-phospholipid synthase family protein [Pseudoxanthomonas winnipegensis]TAA20172.1 class I SAM-dependent methyltransferase [Pseudoxanthomonas winnipegensis]
MTRLDASTTPAASTPADSGSFVERLLRRRLLDTLGQLRGGRLVLEEAGQMHVLGHCAADEPAPLSAHLRVHDPAFWRMAALNGSVGAGEAWMEGLWDCDDLVALMRLLVRNRDLLDAMDSGTARLGGAAMKLLHACARNTRRGSRRNIAAHYDLGNALFALFLDENLMYSSAIYEDQDESLEVAATRKLDRICQKLQLGPQHRVVEIGTGWGGFALHAAERYGCHVTTTTISREQHDLAAQRIAQAGLQDRITLLMRDYRDLEGRFDRLVSIEMIEAIGHQYLDTYFAKVGDLLAHEGQALIQAITIEDHRYVQARDSVDFIKRHIFPGSFIPSVAAMTGAMAKASDLRLFNLEDIGPSYALTLRAWRARFASRLDEVRALGYDARFIRMWVFYLAYCEAGFLERSIGDVQLWLTRPGARATQYPYALAGA